MKRKLLLFLAWMATSAPSQEPLFSFAAIADVQYAERAKAGKRDYRSSLVKLERFVAEVNRVRPAFAIQLGDLVDGGADNLERALAVYRRIAVPRRHVLGNHDFCADRAVILRQFELRRAYYTFARPGWRFVVLDGMDVSVTGGWAPDSPNFLRAKSLLQELQANLQKNAVDWNGGLGAEQTLWLRRVLRDAAGRGERVIVFSHFPVAERASSAHHLLWNHAEIRRIVESAGSVAAYINGHDHTGGYAYENGIHYITLEGVVESGEENAYAFLRVWPHRIELIGTGKVKNRSLELGAGKGAPRS